MSYKLRHAMTQKQLDQIYFMKRNLLRKQKNVTMQKSLNKETSNDTIKKPLNTNRQSRHRR